MKTKIIISIFIISALFACNSDCTDVYKTTGMNIILSENTFIDSIPYVKWDKKFMRISFDYEYDYFCGNMGTASKFLNKIDSFEIQCSSDYNSTHLAGSNLADIIEVTYHQFTGINNYDEYINFDSYLQDDSKCRLKFIFRFTIPPSDTTLQRFNIKYKESDGTQYSFITKPFFIIP